MLAVRLYDVILAVHVTAIVIAFGVVFSYPVVLPWLRCHHAESMGVAHEVTGRLGRLVITPAATVALFAGIYLASDRGLWSEIWVTIPLVILVAILGLGGAVLAPMERRLSGLAAGGADSPEYDATFRRMMTLTNVIAALVLLAIFLMVVKPGS